jgi:hypothetical protein
MLLALISLENMLSAYFFSISIRFWHVIFKSCNDCHRITQKGEVQRMLLTEPAGIRMNSKPNDHPHVHIPTIYEKIDAQPVQWEYHILSFDARETPLPDAETLNALGKEGWIMVGLLDERMSGSGGMIHYYFARQAKESL